MKRPPTATRPGFRVPDGTEIVLVIGVEALWHLPKPGSDEPLERATLCGLAGPVYVYAPVTATRRRCCTVCAARASKGLLKRIARPRRRRPKRIPELQVRALHLAHWEQRVPVNELGRRYWQRFGFASPAACGNSLGRYFHELGLPVHDRIEMTVQASTKHGMKRRKGNSAAYKRFRAEQKGEQYDAPCTGLTRAGKPCRVRAMTGRDVCQFHDPDRHDAHLAHLAEMRARSPIHDPERLEPAQPLIELLRAFHSDGGRWRDLAHRTQLPAAWLSHVAHGGQAQVDRRRAQRVRDVLLPIEMAA